MWDLKPAAPDSIRGPFHPISTTVPGLRIGDLLPMTAQQAHRFSIIRSMVHTSTSHDVGIKYTLLGDSTAPGPAYPPRRSDHPGMGAIIRSLRGDLGAIAGVGRVAATVYDRDTLLPRTDRRIPRPGL